MWNGDALSRSSVTSLKLATREELLAVEDVGDVIADSVLAYFQADENLREIERLYDAGLQFAVEVPAQKASSLLEGKTIVISGNFSISRDEMKALIEAHGGKNGSSVSSKTAYLLAGSKPGPEKVKKANELGISIIDENQFYEMIGSAEEVGFSVANKMADAPEKPTGPSDEPTLF